ncbi:uncharacterized protein LOC107027515 [Solanum pennellii]|uniref:Uncharacterized protein LOC107027515 n=1 Tax=Solanum pennellii TaxID=28526 RepID=A0ABM1HE24_SOLPN|nr:uncharacterized protein LOC107027515 [Solanum pennellii]
MLDKDNSSKQLCLSPSVEKNDEFVSLTVIAELRLFAGVDDIPCMFQGHIENVVHLKQQYGLNNTANEVIILIEAYRTLRDTGPYPPDQAVKDIHGKFASFFMIVLRGDVGGSVPFFWGTDSEGHLVLSDDADIVKHGCGKSFAPFPIGNVNELCFEGKGPAT